MLIVVIVALIALDLLASARVIAALASRSTWRQRPRPYGCLACRVDYTDPRALAWHLQGQHRDVYDYANDHAVAQERAA